MEKSTMGVECHGVPVDLAEEEEKAMEVEAWMWCCQPRREDGGGDHGDHGDGKE